MSFAEPTRSGAVAFVLALTSCAGDGPAPSDTGDVETQADTDTGEAPTYTLAAEFVGLQDRVLVSASRVDEADNVEMVVLRVNG